MTLFTFGHGNASEDELALLIRNAGFHVVVDVRTVPKSRRHPHVWSAALAQWIPQKTGASYVHEPALGGFRKTTPESKNVALRNTSFRGYADYMETVPFRVALDALMQQAAQKATAIMCSETLWWRCHRRLIADAATLLCGASVLHLMHDGSLARHALTEGVRARPEGTLRYDQGVLL